MTKMDELIEKLQEHVCDNLCMHPNRVGISRLELDGICAECEMGELVCGILNEYNQLGAVSKALETTYQGPPSQEVPQHLIGPMWVVVPNIKR